MRFLAIIFLLFTLSVFTQEKFEREYRVDKDKVPRNSLHIIKK